MAMRWLTWTVVVALAKRCACASATPLTDRQLASAATPFASCSTRRDVARSLLNRLAEAPRTALGDSVAAFPLLPPGQIRPRDCETLYNAGLVMPGPFLEIGAFIGRSAYCIALGIKDSKKKKSFYSIDLHIDSKAAYYEFFGDPLGANLTVPHMDEWWASGLSGKKMGYSWYVEHGGTEVFMRHNLKKAGLLSYVQIIKGDFTVMAPRLKFDLVYADHLHDKHEIAKNLPFTLELLAPGGTIVMDDIVKNSKESFPGENRQMVHAHSTGVLARKDIGHFYAQTLSGASDPGGSADCPELAS